jgi:hypothetical protein
VICEQDVQDKITQSLQNIPAVTKVLCAKPGGPAQLIE